MDFPTVSRRKGHLVFKYEESMSFYSGQGQRLALSSCLQFHRRPPGSFNRDFPDGLEPTTIAGLFGNCITSPGVNKHLLGSVKGPSTRPGAMMLAKTTCMRAVAADANRPSPSPPACFRHFVTRCRHPGTVSGGRFVFHYTPTHGSWLNQIELWFSILSRRILRYGDFASVADLVAAIEAFIRHWNQAEAHPFRWTSEGLPLVR